MGLPNSKYIWCLHCERVSFRDDWYENDENCPCCNTFGGAGDGFKWQTISKPNGYSDEPELGKRYEMYSSNYK